MRHLLFDIDGTLISTGRAGSRGMLAAIRELTGIADPETTVFHGRTDAHLVPELLRVNGCEPSDELVEQAQCSYFRHLDEALEDCQGMVLPGIIDLLHRLKQHATHRIGLLTGNLPRSAEMKLTHYGIWQHFELGFFGDISPDRNELAQRAWHQLSTQFPQIVPGDIVIIGDTPMDVECAKSIGAKCVGCATGGIPAAELLACGADWTFDDLSDVDTVLDVLLNG